MVHRLNSYYVPGCGGGLGNFIFLIASIGLGGVGGVPGPLPGAAGGAGSFRPLLLAGADFFFLNGFIFLKNSPGGGGGGGACANAVAVKPIIPKLNTPANNNLAVVFLRDFFFVTIIPLRGW